MTNDSKSVLDDTDAALNKAADYENKMVEATDPDERTKAKKNACLFFKRAMKNDGNTDYNEMVLGE